MITEQVIENNSLSKIEGKLVRWLEQPGGLEVQSCPDRQLDLFKVWKLLARITHQLQAIYLLKTYTSRCWSAPKAGTIHKTNPEPNRRR